MAVCWPSGQTCSPILGQPKGGAADDALGLLNSAVTLATDNNTRNTPTRSRLHWIVLAVRVRRDGRSGGTLLRQG